jgi:hypothetical protein
MIFLPISEIGDWGSEIGVEGRLGSHCTVFTAMSSLLSTAVGRRMIYREGWVMVVVRALLHSSSLALVWQVTPFLPHTHTP